MKRTDRPETSFGGPQVSPGLDMNPVAEKTRRSMEGRGLYRTPVAGGTNPPIPRLDMPAAEGSTMADQANLQRMPPPGPAVQAAGMIQPGLGTASAGSFAPPPKPGDGRQLLLPSDILPNEARQDPEFRDGTGAMYATAQPNLARKYGVIRSGRRIAPQELGSPSPGLSKDTVAGLQAVANFQKTREHAESEDDAVESASSASPAGSAARFGQSGNEKPLTEDERKRVEAAAQRMDDFDFHTLREMMMKDILNNEDQRKLIEGRLEPMDLAEYVMNGSVTQRVPINSKLTYVFESVDGQVDLALKRLIIKETQTGGGFSTDDRYILDKYAIMAMACSISEINNIKLPAYRDANGNFDDKLFWEKFNRVSRLGLHMIASIGINAFWFDIRVRKLLVADSLGNG